MYKYKNWCLHKNNCVHSTNTKIDAYTKTIMYTVQIQKLMKKWLHTFIASELESHHLLQFSVSKTITIWLTATPLCVCVCVCVCILWHTNTMTTTFNSKNRYMCYSYRCISNGVPQTEEEPIDTMYVCLYIYVCVCVCVCVCEYAILSDVLL